MFEVYVYLNGHSVKNMNNVFKLKENMYSLQKFHIFQTENPRSLKYGLMLFHIVLANRQVPIDIRETASLTLFKSCT